jgi:hypothetical protein
MATGIALFQLRHSPDARERSALGAAVAVCRPLHLKEMVQACEWENVAPACGAATGRASDLFRDVIKSESSSLPEAIRAVDTRRAGSRTEPGGVQSPLPTTLAGRRERLTSLGWGESVSLSDLPPKIRLPGDCPREPTV